MNKAWKTAGFAAAFLGAVGSLEGFDPASQAAGPVPEKTRKIRFIEDDAQDYMVTKVYSLKYIKANDIVPFVLGAVMRYSTNSKVDRINYAAAKQQWLAVTTPVAMMPYVDDMVAKMDRPSKIKDVNGSIVRGTGITRYVYNPKWRSSQDMVTLMVKAGIPADASGYDYSYDSEDSSAGKYDGRVLYDSASNLIYWKDSPNKSSDLLKYLTWLDRPVPQVIVTFRLYEVRDSDLRDIGIDYAAWKNGPGLQLAGFGADLFAGRWNETVQVAEAASKLMPFISDSMSWGYGSMFFAPAFDMSFIRLLQQNGRARELSEVSLTLRNGKNAATNLAPDYQNILKKENDKTYVRRRETRQKRSSPLYRGRLREEIFRHLRLPVLSGEHQRHRTQQLRQRTDGELHTSGLRHHPHERGVLPGLLVPSDGRGTDDRRPDPLRASDPEIPVRHHDPEHRNHALLPDSGSRLRPSRFRHLRDFRKTDRNHGTRCK